MVVIYNNTKSVRVLQAVGVKPLRLFPGFNQFTGSKEDLAKFTDGNKAAQAMFRNDLKIVNEEMTEEEKAQAIASKEKNDTLNKAKKVIQVQEKDIKKQKTEIDDLKKKIEKLEKIIEKGGK